VVDTTAAEDTFNGAALTTLLDGKPLDDGIIFAHAVTAITVIRAGVQTSIFYRVKVDDFLNKL